MTVALSPAHLAIRRRAVAVELERRRRRKAKVVPDAYGEWIATARPNLLGLPVRWDARHFRVMQATLDRVTTGEARRVIFQVPIRHAKTEHNTKGYSVYRLERNPRTRVLFGTYNQTQANTVSRQIRSLAGERGIALSADRDAASEWETAAGGSFRAVGVGTGAASLNADLIVIDDPFGSRSDAESQAKRDEVWDWLTNDMLARTEPHTAVLLSMSRWHDDDVVGRIRDRFGEAWEVVDLPGRAEKDDPLGREIGEPLWPEERGEAWHDEKLMELLEYGYASLVQGRPRPREGGMFKWDWWKLGAAVPATGTLIRYWDMAGTRPKGGSHDPDLTAGTLAGRTPDKQTVIVHQDAFRVEVAARDAKIEERAKADLAAYGRRVVYWLERQAGISGDEATQSLIRRVQNVGIACYAESVTGSKPERATPLASAAMAGNVLLGPDDPAQPWHTPFRSEAADFPHGKHDDRVDSAAGAFNKLATASTSGTFAFKP